MINDKRTLSALDRDVLLHFLKNAPEPNEKLKSTYQKILTLYQIDTYKQCIYNVSSDFIKNIE